LPPLSFNDRSLHGIPASEKQTLQILKRPVAPQKLRKDSNSHESWDSVGSAAPTKALEYRFCFPYPACNRDK